MGRFAFGLVVGALLSGGLTLGAVAAERSGALSLRPIRLAFEQFRRDAVPVLQETRLAFEGVLPEPGAEEVTVVLSRDGRRVYAGVDYARGGFSSVVAASRKAYVDVPVFRGGDRRFHAMTKCLRGHFSRFSVNIVTEPPAAGDYMVAHVGGTSALLGADRRIAGLAPHTGKVISNATIFVFEPKGFRARDLCDVAAHEIGHAIGLDHSMKCSDLMSYGSCGRKSFRSVSARCGEQAARNCDNGDATQSSQETLEKRVGLRIDPALNS